MAVMWQGDRTFIPLVLRVYCISVVYPCCANLLLKTDDHFVHLTAAPSNFNRCDRCMIWQQLLCDRFSRVAVGYRARVSLSRSIVITRRRHLVCASAALHSSLLSCHIVHRSCCALRCLVKHALLWLCASYRELRIQIRSSVYLFV
jgi:hypothetical protein